MEDSLVKLTTYDDFAKATPHELLKLFEIQQKTIATQQQTISSQTSEINKLKECSRELEDRVVEINGQLVILRHKLYGKSTEKKNKSEANKSKPNKKSPKARSKRDKSKLSEKYEELPIMEQHIELQVMPTCSSCQKQLQDSGMTEDSEMLHVIPAKFLIIRQMRHKYRCTGCHSQLITAPLPKRIIPGGMYTDEMILDVALSKYCDLIPIERYSSIAGRSGAVDLPPNSLVSLTHHLASYFEPAYTRLKEEISEARVLHADETPHNMLEGDKKSNWFLWGFSSKNTSYFEIHDSRSGDVASDLLSQTRCEYLVSDVYSGYVKSVKVTNKLRAKMLKPPIYSIYCNAHSRRKFCEAEKNFPEEAIFFIEKYREIYILEADGRFNPEEFGKKRIEMKPHFEAMKTMAEALLETCSSKSLLAKAIKYFLKNYEGLTRFLGDTELPIDNNQQERLLRNAVIGRKTWYGTHSKRGAKTAAILFSLVESCKLNKINPREYFKKLVQHLHAGGSVFTPRDCSLSCNL